MNEKAISVVVLVLFVAIVVGVVGVAVYLGTQPVTPPKDNVTPLEWNPAKSYTTYSGWESTTTTKLRSMVTGDDIEQIRNMDLKVTIMLQSTAEDWSQLVNAGIRDVAEEFGIEVLTTGWAEWDPVTEIDVIETMMALEPDYIITMTSGPEATSDVYRRAVDAGIKVSILDVVISGLSYPDEAIGVSSSDSVGLGVCSAHIMAEALHEKYGEYRGKVITVDWGIEFFVTNMRELGFRQHIAYYSDIEVVGRETFPDPTKARDVAEAFLTKYPDIDGVFITWTEPCGLGVYDAAAILGRTDLIMTSVDLSERTAIEIARAEGPIFAGITDQDPYELGVNAVYQIVLHEVGKEVPPFVVAPTMRVTRGNLIESWEKIMAAWKPEVPAAVLELLD